MTTDHEEFRCEVLLSVQRALWDVVTTPLRAVAVNPRNPNIHGRLIYEHVGEVERMIAAEVESYVIADFSPAINVRFAAVALPLAESRELQPGEQWVFRRQED